jgi:hypothetical protein
VASPQKKSLGATTALSQKKSLRAKFVPMTTVHEFNSSDPPSKQNEHGEDSELLSPIHEQRQPLLCQLQGNPNNENIDALLQRMESTIGAPACRQSRVQTTTIITRRETPITGDLT